MSHDTASDAQHLLPRPLFGDSDPDFLFEPLGLAPLVSAELLVSTQLLGAGLALPQPGFVSAETAIATPVTAAGASGPITAALTGADQAVLGSIARASSGASGAGVVIGILSDSFNVKGGYAADVGNGLLNGNVTVLKEGAAGSSDEGRAMAQLIHQIAPNAQIMFYSAFSGAADFATGIHALANAGASVIVDDVTYLNEPFYQAGGVIASAVQQVVASGVSYFTSASNQGDNFYENGFNPLYGSLPGLTGGFVANNFGTGSAPNPYVNLTVARGATVTLDLQWDQPFASISGSGAATSLGMVLYDNTGHIVAYALRSAIGGDPVSLLQFTNSASATSFHLAVITDGGRGVPGAFKFIAYGQGVSIDDAHAGIGSGTIIGHEMVAAANTVGAVAYANTAAFGGHNTLESFSSVGPGSYLFDAAGHRLAAPVQAGGVDYLAPDGSATSVFNPFYGTSAAAPNAAAVAALMKQANPGMTPAQVSAALAASTVAASGPSDGTGAGLIQASAAVKAAIALAGPAGKAGSFTLPTGSAAPSGSSAAISNAASAITAGLDAQPAMLNDFVATPDFASGLVTASTDSLGGVSFANLALMNSADPLADALFNPVHILPPGA